jgi:phosphatidylethanolamine-binding protein (PEBP) family uncharacterized protein
MLGDLHQLRLPRSKGRLAESARFSCVFSRSQRHSTRSHSGRCRSVTNRHHNHYKILTITSISLILCGLLTSCGDTTTSRLTATPQGATSANNSRLDELRNLMAARARARVVAVPPTPSSRVTLGRHRASAVSLDVSLPSLSHEDEIPARYTCNGGDEILPVRWTNIPSGTQQLALFIINFKPTRNKLFFDWAITGLNPRSTGITPNTITPGVIMARNSFGRVDYSICPPPGTREHFVVRLVALSHSLSAIPGTPAASLYAEAERHPAALGITGGNYERPQ